MGAKGVVGGEGATDPAAASVAVGWMPCGWISERVEARSSGTSIPGKNRDQPTHLPGCSVVR